MFYNWIQAKRSSLSDYEKHSIWSGSGKSSATKSSREETIEMEESDVKKVAKSTVVSSAKKTNRADKGKQQSASTRVCIRHAATVMKVKDFPKCEAPKCQCDHSSPSSNADYHGLMTAVRMTSMYVPGSPTTLYCGVCRDRIT